MTSNPWYKDYVPDHSQHLINFLMNTAHLRVIYQAQTYVFLSINQRTKTEVHDVESYGRDACLLDMTTKWESKKEERKESIAPYARR